MIKTEFLTIGGKDFVKTWSDSGKMIQRDGVFYEEAMDPAGFDRVYTETEQDIELSAEEALGALTEVLA